MFKVVKVSTSGSVVKCRIDTSSAIDREATGVVGSYTVKLKVSRKESAHRADKLMLGTLLFPG